MDELLRMKRKEKHMAPIDCSGLPGAFNLTWKCRPCNRQHNCKEDCDFYRYYHEPRHVIMNKPENPGELPDELEKRPDGIYTKKCGLKPYTRLGPLKGKVRLSFTSFQNVLFKHAYVSVFCAYCDKTK